MFGSSEAADEHRRLSHDDKKLSFDSSTIDFEKLQYEDGAQSLLEQLSCSKCSIFFINSNLKDEHVKNAHGEEKLEWKIKSDLKPAHSPGE